MRLTSFKRFAFLVVGVATLCAAGCDNSPSSGSPNSASAGTTDQPAPQNYTMLKRTTQAFNFYIVSGGNVTLYDMTDNTEVWTADLPPNSLIQFDPKTGIVIANKTLLEGPLPENHLRELRLNR